MRLMQDDYPILMEGIHCTYLLNDERFNERKFFVRLHNVEFIYYRHLFQFTKSVSKKLTLPGNQSSLENMRHRLSTKPLLFL
jgi:hypothetical protein